MHWGVGLMALMLWLDWSHDDDLPTAIRQQVRAWPLHAMWCTVLETVALSACARVELLLAMVRLGSPLLVLSGIRNAIVERSRLLYGGHSAPLGPRSVVLLCSVLSCGSPGCSRQHFGVNKMLCCFRVQLLRAAVLLQHWSMYHTQCVTHRSRFKLYGIPWQHDMHALFNSSCSKYGCFA
jgi:hypothetical protein